MKNAIDSGMFSLYVCRAAENIYFFDDCREITSHRGCISHSHSNQFFPILTSFQSFVNLSFFFDFADDDDDISFSIFDIVHRKMHIKNWKSIGCFVCVCVKERKKNVIFFFTWAKKKNSLQTHIFHLFEYALSCICFYLLNGIGHILHSISGYCEIKIFSMLFFIHFSSMCLLLRSHWRWCEMSPWSFDPGFL